MYNIFIVSSVQLILLVVDSTRRDIALTSALSISSIPQPSDFHAICEDLDQPFTAFRVHVQYQVHVHSGNPCLPSIIKQEFDHFLQAERS